MHSNCRQTRLTLAGCKTGRWIKTTVSDGRVFHTDGPATEKLRGPKPTVLVLGTARSPWPADRRWRRVDTAEIGEIIDSRYGAASWWRHLWTRRQSLKSIHSWTMSQCRVSRRVGVMLSDFLFFAVRSATAFITNCRVWRFMTAVCKLSCKLLRLILVQRIDPSWPNIWQFVKQDLL